MLLRPATTTFRRLAVRHHGGGGPSMPKIPDVSVALDFFRAAGEKPSPAYKEAMGKCETVGRHGLACWALYTSGAAILYTIVS